MELQAIAVLEGDQTGQELLEESLRVLAPEVTGLELALPRYDLSLERRRASDAAMRAITVDIAADACDRLLCTHANRKCG